MANTIYQSTITAIGPLAKDVLSDGMLITFKEGCPADLADYCFIHSHGVLAVDLAIGQQIKLGSVTYSITAVGQVASYNFTQLGHITIRFDGQHLAELPGTIHVNGDAPAQLSVGDTLTIFDSK